MSSGDFFHCSVSLMALFVVLKSEIIQTFYIKFYSQMHRFHVLNYSRIELLFLRRRFLKVVSVRESDASLTPSDSVSARMNLWDFIDWLVTGGCQIAVSSLLVIESTVVQKIFSLRKITFPLFFFKLKELFWKKLKWPRYILYWARRERNLFSCYFRRVLSIGEFLFD